MKIDESIKVINEMIDTINYGKNAEDALKKSVNALETMERIMRTNTKGRFKIRIEEMVDNIYKEMMSTNNVTRGEIYPEQAIEEDKYIDSLANILTEILMQNMD